jgi:hypothetical protein
MKRSGCGLALLLCLGVEPGAAADVARPETVLGFRVGDDYRLADWAEIAGYFEALAEASPRVQVEDVGDTTKGRPFLVVTISSEKNIGRLDEIRQQNLRLWDPRSLSEAEAERLVRTGKTIVASNHGIHANEVAASQTAMLLAHLLASSASPEILEILDETVVLMIPSHNPDGTQEAVEWYRSMRGTAYEAGPLPFLYQEYTGHDNNRDWYMFTQVETRLTLDHVYNRWRPQIVHDLHQMGAYSARLFLPPYTDPWEPNVDPALTAAANGLGAHIAAQLIGQGKAGVVIHALFDAWTPARAYPHTHGGVRILSECASARFASPIEVSFDELRSRRGFDPRKRSWRFPSVWPGGSWRLRDAVEYQLATSLALLQHAARHRDYWLRGFLAVNRRAASRQTPYAFVLPASQQDPLAAGGLIEVLKLGSVEVERATASFQAGDSSFAAGSHVVRMQQPASAFAKTVLERQSYPEHRAWAGGPIKRPYDVTAHTLPLLMGVAVEPVETPFEVECEPVRTGERQPGSLSGAGAHFVLGHGNAELVALGRLLRAGVPVRWAQRGFEDRGRRFPAGSLLVASRFREVLEPIVVTLGLHAAAVDAEPDCFGLRSPRIGLYQSWVASTDEGWTRFFLERHAELPYSTLHDAEVRSAELHRDYDVIVLPDQSEATIVRGHRRGTLPDEYVGGLGEEGIAGLRRFVTAGGTLVALNRACEMVIAALQLPLQDVLAELRESRDEFFCPGSILAVRPERDHPLCHGLPGQLPVWFQNGPAFRIESGSAVLRYPDEDPLLSGWLVGGERLTGRAALAEVPLGRGRAVLFGFRPQYRGQAWASYPALLNAIYTSASSSPSTDDPSQ